MRKAELHSEVHTSFLVPSFLASWDLTYPYIKVSGIWPDATWSLLGNTALCIMTRYFLPVICIAGGAEFIT